MRLAAPARAIVLKGRVGSGQGMFGLTPDLTGSGNLVKLLTLTLTLIGPWGRAKAGRARVRPGSTPGHHIREKVI